MIPGFVANGSLPPGVHEATWEEFKAHFGTNRRRRHLLAGRKRALENLASAGCRRVFVDGSFVTDCEYPNDYDACWDPDGVDPKMLDPVFLDIQAPRAAQKARYGGDLFPTADLSGSGFTFLDFFQRDREGERKGIILIRLAVADTTQGES